MNTKKLILASAVASALAGVGGAQASIIGVPGEALLVAFAAQDNGEATGPNVNDDDVINTAVILTTPAVVGTDTVLNGYTLPNVLDALPDGYYVAPADINVHWAAFDEYSKIIESGTFDMSPNDVYFWSPINENLYEYIGYLVFSDTVALKGDKAATFAMAGDAFMLLEESCEALGDPEDGLCATTSDQNLTLPVVPMSDGVDWCQTRPLPGGVPQKNTPINCYAEPLANGGGNPQMAITYGNNVVARLPAGPGINQVGHVSPLVAGVRMQAPYSSTDPTYATGGKFNTVMAQALYSPFDGNWTHVFWFSESVEGRKAISNAYDDDEQEADCADLPIPNEVNGFVFADRRNRIIDLVRGFRLATDNDGDTDFADACIKTNGSLGEDGQNCRAICGSGSGFANYDEEDEFSQAYPGIGLIDYVLAAGPYDTSTGVFFQFMSSINWNSEYAEEDIAVGSNFDVYAGGYQPMVELGKL
jgi:hypothetical protein